jgi:hypothetical protein
MERVVLGNSQQQVLQAQLCSGHGQAAAALAPQKMPPVRMLAHQWSGSMGRKVLKTSAQYREEVS